MTTNWAATPKQNALIALLTLSAIILAVVLVVLPARPRAADAAVTVTAGDFTLATIPNGAGGDETVAVTDQRSQRMVVYMMQENRLLLIGAVNLGAGFTAPVQAQPVNRR